MRKMKISLFLLTLVLLTSCSLKVNTLVNKQYESLVENTEVLLLKKTDKMPSNAEALGVVKISDAGMTTKCGYNTVVEKAKQEARKLGGNIIKITDHIRPNLFGSSCHQITAHILKIDSFDNMVYTAATEIEKLDVDYAILHVYRSSGLGPLVTYKLHLGDSILCKVRNNFKTTLHIKKEGMNTLWAKTESKVEVPVDFEYGREYYLRCGVKMGAFVGRPTLELVDHTTGKLEFTTIKERKKQ